MPKGIPGRLPCSIDGCGKALLARGWCSMHYDRWRRYGDVFATRRSLAQGREPARFWAKVNKNGPIPAYPA